MRATYSDMHRVYTRIWLGVWAPPAAAACLAGLATTDVTRVLFLSVLMAGLAAVSVLPFGQGRSTEGGPRGVAALRATRVAAGTIAVSGWMALLGDLVWPIAVIAGITSPPAARFVRSLLRSRSVARLAAGASLPPDHRMSSAVEDLDDLQLCRVWHRSYFSLREARSVGQRCKIVALRQACMEEMERRDPDGLRSWLASSPHPFEAPEPHVRRRRDHRPGGRESR